MRIIKFFPLCWCLLSLISVRAVAADTEPQLDVYSGRQSVVAGEVVTFHVSANTRSVALSIVRIGVEEQEVFQLDEIAVTTHPVPARASSDGCGWPVAVTVPVLESWDSGYYEARFVGQREMADGSKKRASGTAFFVVRALQPGQWEPGRMGSPGTWRSMGIPFWTATVISSR